MAGALFTTNNKRPREQANFQISEAASALILLAHSNTGLDAHYSEVHHIPVITITLILTIINIQYCRL